MTDQLPQNFFQQKKQLLNYFKDAQSKENSMEGRKWRVRNGM